MKSLTTVCIFVIICFQLSFAQDLELELFASNLNRPVNIKHAGDDRLFVVEQEGSISIVNADGSVNTTPFLDIDSKVGAIGGIGDEKGLLGLAFHPNYSSNGYFYVNYINNSGDTVISRFTRDATNSALADENSELILLSYFQPFGNHNGGDLAFGPDGYLYISSGDGGAGGDPQNNSQDTSNLLGNILRIDVDSTTGTLNYSIPSDNPFIGSPTASEEIWAYGLRNPWKFSFDRTNGDIWIADVGQNGIEEINTAPSTIGGLNFGWRCYEGSAPFNTAGCSAIGNYTFPVSEYSHTGDGLFKCSITGGYRYRGTTYPNFNGLYFFADYCSEEIGYIEYDTINDEWDMTLEQFSGSWTAFGEDNNGEVYVTDIQTGNIYKLTDASLSIDEFDLNSISIYPNPTKDELNIDFSNNNSVTTELLIYDIQGKIVKSILRNSETIQKINTSALATGIYILRINTSNGKQSTYKLIKD